MITGKGGKVKPIIIFHFWTDSEWNLGRGRDFQNGNNE